ncbi:MAG: hypothetical protein NZ992_00590 [Candidatus Korarchaeum sp.]|nr:hypothetical protein [Candidatus Korarchaeum sp.]MDW8035235.1 hypothetical protein [Candidatus Korarchaeum sp.]
MLSIERMLLTSIGIVLIVITVSSLSDEIRIIKEKRDENCLNTALSSVDLAITKAVGGGVAETYVFLPVRVSYECNGRTVKLTVGNKSVSLSYPFRVVCGGEAYLTGRFHANWRRDIKGDATLVLSWSGARG